MSYEPPDSLSPSRLSTFLSCPLRFRFESLDRFPTTSGVAALSGTTIHRALELLMADPPEQRTPKRLEDLTRDAIEEFESDPALIDPDVRAVYTKSVWKSSGAYFAIEDPTTVTNIEGLELKLEVDVDGLILRGIIDRLERQDGLVIVDYKGGKVPGEKYEAKALIGMHCYSLMCELHFGEIPERMVLMYVTYGKTITARPSGRSNRAIRQKINAVRGAIERACEHDSFQANAGPLCNYCDFKPFCPAHDGNPQEAFVQLQRRPERTV